MGWAIREDPVVELLEKLRAKHDLPKGRWKAWPRMPPMPALLQQLYDVMGGGPLFGGALVLTAPDAVNYPLRSPDDDGILEVVAHGAKFATLRDGSFLVVTPVHQRAKPTQWLVVHGSAADPEKWPVLAMSLLELLQRLAHDDTFDPAGRYGVFGDYD
ncbi:MAG: hypothetical protein JNK82_41690 [Myxococcaceae bacterium]|nr:hypothetical protein [Myxococcaceae bacterium]